MDNLDSESKWRSENGVWYSYASGPREDDPNPLNDFGEELIEEFGVKPKKYQM